MVSSELLERVAALSEDDRVQLAVYIQETLGAGGVPDAEQQALVEGRDDEMRANLELGLSKDEAVAALRALRA